MTLKAVSGIMLTLLMASILSVGFNVTSVVGGSSSTVTFRVEDVTKDAYGFPGLVLADIYIDSPEGSAIVGWRVNIKVDPDVLEPGYDFNGDVLWAVSGFEGYFLYDWATPNYTTLFDPGARSVTAGKIIGTLEGIVGWLSLEPGTGANGTGKLVTLLFTYKNETAYSPIEITEAYYYTTWNNPNLPVDKRVPDIIFHGHYNEPALTAAVVDVNPDALNLKSRGEWITCYIELPEGYNVSDIDIHSIRLNNTFPVSLLVVPPVEVPTEIGDHDDDTVLDLMVKFNRTTLTSHIYHTLEIKYGNVTLTITGELSDGTLFKGSDTIRVNFAGDICGVYDGVISPIPDGEVTGLDFAEVALPGHIFGRYPTWDPVWGPICDLNKDGKVTAYDLMIAGINYGATVPPQP